MDNSIKLLRDFMKGYSVADFDDPENDFNSSDQQKGVTPPPLLVEDAGPKSNIVPLPEFSDSLLRESNILRVMKKRRSRRRYTGDPLSMPELSYMLWATQGVKSIDRSREWSIRTVPSAGARHPYETYLIVNRVDGLDAGIYRYIPFDHGLLCKSAKPGVRDKVFAACYGEDFVADAPVCFVWTCVPYRGEWRYNSKAHKSMLLDAGHICHSLYLSAESIGCGVCAIGGYHQQGFDSILGVDGVDEFTVYLAPVGRVRGDQ